MDTTNKQRLLDAYDAAPKIDFHTHLKADHPAAQRIEDLIYYHMLLIEMSATGLDISRFQREHFGRHEVVALDASEAAASFARVRNSSLARAFQALVADIFHVDGPRVDEAYFQQLSTAVSVTGADPNHVASVLDRMNIQAALAPVANHAIDKIEEEYRQAHSRIRFTLERGYFNSISHTQKVMEKVEEYEGIRLTDLDAARALVERTLSTGEAVRARAYVAWVWTGRLLADEDPSAAAAALRNSSKGQNWTIEDSAALNTMEFRMKLDAARERGKTVQLCTSSAYMSDPVYPLPHTPDDYLPTLVAWISRYPDVTFDILNCDAAIDQTLMTLARTRPNVNLSGIWWHAMSEGWIAEMMYRRILAVPIYKLGCFFSDAYCVEWVYGKHVIMRQGVASAFARAVNEGLFSLRDAEAYMRQMLFDNPTRIYRLA